MEYLLFRDGLMSGTGISDVTGKLATKYADPPNVPDMQFYFGGFLASCAKTGQVGELLSNGSRSVQIFPAVLHPKSRGYITLASNDPLAPPKIFANYLSDDQDHDIKVLIEGIKFAVRLSETDSLKAYGMELDRKPVEGCESIPFGTDKYWECAVRRNTGPENHQAGSCKMGPARDTMAVVDHELRVSSARHLCGVECSLHNNFFLLVSGAWSAKLACGRCLCFTKSNVRQHKCTRHYDCRESVTVDSSRLGRTLKTLNK